jgi:hypothetical protein
LSLYKLATSSRNCLKKIASAETAKSARQLLTEAVTN